MKDKGRLKSFFPIYLDKIHEQLAIPSYPNYIFFWIFQVEASKWEPDAYMALRV
jgi:hypothetical protein